MLLLPDFRQLFADTTNLQLCRRHPIWKLPLGNLNSPRTLRNLENSEFPEFSEFREFPNSIEFREFQSGSSQSSLVAWPGVYIYIENRLHRYSTYSFYLEKMKKAHNRTIHDSSSQSSCINSTVPRGTSRLPASRLSEVGS